MRIAELSDEALATSAWWPWVLLGLLCVSPLAAQAAPYNFTWTGTVSTTGDPLPPGVATGDLFDFTFTVDNGAASSLLQTWTENDFVKATINVNNRVQRATALLPEEVRRQGVTVAKRSSSILQVLTMSSGAKWTPWAR